MEVKRWFSASIISSKTVVERTFFLEAKEKIKHRRMSNSVMQAWNSFFSRKVSRATTLKKWIAQLWLITEWARKLFKYTNATNNNSGCFHHINIDPSIWLEGKQRTIFIPEFFRSIKKTTRISCQSRWKKKSYIDCKSFEGKWRIDSR